MDAADLVHFDVAQNALYIEPTSAIACPKCTALGPHAGRIHWMIRIDPPRERFSPEFHTAMLKLNGNIA
jgi:hypothetical protein